MVARLEDWPMRLSEYLKERRDMPFQWGVHDCMMFLAYGVERMTGEAFYPPYSNYETEEGAKLMLEQNGGVTGIINACLGPSHKDFMRAGRGDAVIVKMPEIAGGIVDDSGQRIAAVSLKDGLVKLPLSSALRIWSF